MIKIFIDSDVILDLLIKRNDYQSTAELFTKIAEGKYNAYTTPIVFANVHYILTKYGRKRNSIVSLRKLRTLLSILTINEEIIDEALLLDAKDFEDSIQYITSEINNLDFIITRNKKDYKESKLPVLTSSDFLQIKI